MSTGLCRMKWSAGSLARKEDAERKRKEESPEASWSGWGGRAGAQELDSGMAVDRTEENMRTDVYRGTSYERAPEHSTSSAVSTPLAVEVAGETPDSARILFSSVPTSLAARSCIDSG